jgi:hypothetical protein
MRNAKVSISGHVVTTGGGVLGRVVQGGFEIGPDRERLVDQVLG